MGQLGRDPDLLEKPVAAEHGGEVGMEQLECDGPVMTEIVGPVDYRHTASAKLGFQAIAVGQRGLKWGNEISHLYVSVGCIKMRRLGANRQPLREPVIARSLSANEIFVGH